MSGDRGPMYSHRTEGMGVSEHVLGSKTRKAERCLTASLAVRCFGSIARLRGAMEDIKIRGVM